MTRTQAQSLIASFRRNDLIAALERAPQQVRPRALYRLAKDDLRDALALALVGLPEVQETVFRMAEHRDRTFRRAFWTE